MPLLDDVYRYIADDDISALSAAHRRADACSDRNILVISVRSSSLCGQRVCRTVARYRHGCSAGHGDSRVIAGRYGIAFSNNMYGRRSACDADSRTIANIDAGTFQINGWTSSCNSNRLIACLAHQINNRRR